jgi:hypothetical protein
LRQAGLSVPPLPETITLESLEGAIRRLSKLPAVPFFMPEIANALNCGAQSAELPIERQKQCIHPGWHYNAQDMHGFLLNEPHPEHEWTAAEINLYTMRTADPCLADRSAGLPFCVDEIIHGARTIPDPTDTEPPGLSIMGASILGDH